jgi:hypothetical protein
MSTLVACLGDPPTAKYAPVGIPCQSIRNQALEQLHVLLQISGALAQNLLQLWTLTIFDISCVRVTAEELSTHFQLDCEVSKRRESNHDS